ncbi:MAG: LysR family transcriptional regulator [Rubrivivax sp.]|nr:MAG: LysR family transcriptional regulator [Rubrivivax sp.]
MVAAKDTKVLASMQGIRLQHLVLCRTLAATGTVRETARLLHRTQPAITKMLQELEASIGVRLFERGRLGTRATPSGLAFMGCCEWGPRQS